jgi:hypothetical protein
MNWVILTSLGLLAAALVINAVAVSYGTSDIKMALQSITDIEKLIERFKSMGAPKEFIDFYSSMANFTMAIVGGTFIDYIFIVIFSVFGVMVLLLKDKVLNIITTVVFGLLGAAAFGWSIFTSVSINKLLHAPGLGQGPDLTGSHGLMIASPYVSAGVCVAIAALGLLNHYGKRR